ncbi:hypothetical protein HYH03_018640 [Edaphochlamys debaryana]|uniref:Uncharacterized protein n=1 Tax=Edaphochlamys debaryana TaxID=47281 RepID=A0A835XHH3_9CHLO|nr:hypothetical protein HYH03_018640 [Edaphochlamys debaryana]|eukprot:KAG2482436.1 hypothetical protein HYH03_018640 [Edaphochlamys debaryana]
MHNHNQHASGLRDSPLVFKQTEAEAIDCELWALSYYSYAATGCSAQEWRTAYQADANGIGIILALVATVAFAALLQAPVDGGGGGFEGLAVTQQVALVFYVAGMCVCGACALSGAFISMQQYTLSGMIAPPHFLSYLQTKGHLGIFRESYPWIHPTIYAFYVGVCSGTYLACGWQCFIVAVVVLGAGALVYTAADNDAYNGFVGFLRPKAEEAGLVWSGALRPPGRRLVTSLMKQRVRMTQARRSGRQQGGSGGGGGGQGAVRLQLQEV